jgi:hypothetical protein
VGSVYAPVRYGWGVVYWLTVEGVPVVWIEGETVQTLPSGYTQDASLVIDKSSEVGQLVDRESGLGAGFPLTFQLLDTTEARSWLRKWGQQAELTQTVAWNDTEVHVDDVAGWPASGVLWLGLERVSYTGTVGGVDPHFTGCTRGTAGSLASTHVPGSVGGTATDLPRWWRGRQVRLYASPVAPSGAMTGSSLEAEAAEVWRGTLDQGPDRVGGLWEFQAQALDRRLDLPLAEPVTGLVIDLAPRYPVEPGYQVAVHVKGWNAAIPAVALWEFLITLQPYAALPSGTLLTPSQQAEAIKVAWAAALPLAKNLTTSAFNAGTFLGALEVSAGAGKWLWKIVLQAAGVPAGGVISTKVLINSVALSSTKVEHFYQGPAANYHLVLDWQTNGNQLNGASPIGIGVAGLTGVAVELDAPAPGLSTYGKIKVGSIEAAYTKLEQDGTLAFFANLYGEGVKALDLSQVEIGDQVEVLRVDGGKAKNVARELLSSSGTGQRGPYDTQGLLEGYGLDGSTAATSAVNNASFDKLAAGPLVALPIQVVLDGTSLGEILGGLLALSQRGLVVRGDDELGARRQRVAMVSTEPGGSDWTVQILDDHLLTTNGDPVVAVRKRDVPNTIRVLIPQGSDDQDTYQVQDTPAAAQQGVVAVEYQLPFNGKTSKEQVTQWALARFVPAQTEQIVELRLVPWLDIDVGDLVMLEITHFAVWQWSTGTPGYTGNGRVLGLKRDLVGTYQVATVLIDGTTSKLALCPAMVVDSYTGPAAAPTLIRVPRRFYTHLHKSIDLGHGVDLWHFEVALGNEAGGGGYSCSAVTDTGTQAELTITAVLGGAVLSANSWLTLPNVAAATDYQAGFAHVGDGSSWG